jgi:Fur family transcriptional regulator, ferric uptake regulator
MADQHELRDKGLRLTPQRELVLSAVRELGHATPEEVAEKSVRLIPVSIFQLSIAT